MSEKTLEELIAAAEGRSPTGQASQPAGQAGEAQEPAKETAPAEPAKQGGEPTETAEQAGTDATTEQAATPEAGAGQAEIDLSALPENVRAMIEAERKRAADFERAAREADRRARQAAGQLQKLQQEQRNQKRAAALAQTASPGVPSQSPTPAPATQPATGGAPALPNAATAGHAAAASLLASEQWKRLLRDYPEFEEVGKGFTTLASELQSLRESLLSDNSNDPRVRRLEALEARLAELTEAQERTRFATFEREHQPQNHVHVKIVNEVDPETGERYRRHVIEPRSPVFAWFYYGLPEHVRDGINWDDPDDLSALFTDMREAARRQGLIQAEADPAQTPAAPTAPATSAAPNPRVRVAAVPRAPNAGVTRVAPTKPMTVQDELAALIEAADRRAAGS